MAWTSYIAFWRENTWPEALTIDADGVGEDSHVGEPLVAYFDALVAEPNGIAPTSAVGSVTVEQGSLAQPAGGSARWWWQVLRTRRRSPEPTFVVVGSAVSHGAVGRPVVEQGRAVVVSIAGVQSRSAVGPVDAELDDSLERDLEEFLLLVG